MKPLYLYNTATRNKEEFKPVHDEVGIYCCGPTVYNYAHIGNLRTYIFEDVLKRALLAHGYKVKHVLNITDVGHLTSDADSGDDKMEKGAQREGKSVWQIAEFFTSKFKENIKDLNILDPDVWPKATEHISQMINLVKELEKRGFTYKTSDGIYFDTTKFPSYCDFARLDPESLRAGERVDMGDKRSATDFALWKFSPKDQKRQMEWDSPWGIGFPGWHIECSAMSMEYLELPLDIHCGGADHIRVHHTNEIAQSEAATGKKFVQYWAHGEFLVLDKGKMAKSGNNFVTLDSIKDQGIPPLAYRLFCFSAHYRTPLSFSIEGLKAAAHSLSNLRKSVPVSVENKPVDNTRVEQVLQHFYDAVNDDLNMPRAIAALWDILKDTAIEPQVRRQCALKADEILALDLSAVQEQVTETIDTIEGPKIIFDSSTQLSVQLKEFLIGKIQLRRKARKEKNFQLSDQIRNSLASEGIVLKDLPDGTTECLVSAEAVSLDINRVL